MRIRAGSGVLTPVFRNNPLTAADEKIPLSMVHVNSKPQYLVFSLRLPHPLSKYAHFACGQLTEAASRAGFAPSHAADSVQTQTRQHTGFRAFPALFKPSPRP